MLGGQGRVGGTQPIPHPGFVPCPMDFAPQVKVKGALPGDTGAAMAQPGGEFGPWVKGEGRVIPPGCSWVKHLSAGFVFPLMISRAAAGGRCAPTARAPAHPFADSLLRV